jgi:hypothetical protein
MYPNRKTRQKHARSVGLSGSQPARPSWPEEQLAKAQTRLARFRWLADHSARSGRPSAGLLRDIKLAEIDVGLWQGRIADIPLDPVEVRALAKARNFALMYGITKGPEVDQSAQPVPGFCMVP